MRNEPTNADRAEYAGAAVAEYLSIKGEPHGDPGRLEEISDLICDLLHHGALLGFDHQRLINRAMLYFEAETENDEHGHSKAPWLPGHKIAEVESVLSGGKVIAEMIPTDCTREEFEANCALVYAAPQLLVALKGCLKALQRDMTDKERSAVFGDGYGIYQLMEEAEQAIAEAEAAA